VGRLKLIARISPQIDETVEDVDVAQGSSIDHVEAGSGARVERGSGSQAGALSVPRAGYPLYDIIVLKSADPAYIEIEDMDTSIPATLTPYIGYVSARLPAGLDIVLKGFQVEEIRVLDTGIASDRVGTSALAAPIVDPFDLRLRGSAIQEIDAEVLSTYVGGLVYSAVGGGLDSRLDAPFDIVLKPQVDLGAVQVVGTDIMAIEEVAGVESQHLEGEEELPVFEEIVGSNMRFPRGYGETLNRPFIVLVGEDACEWHLPILYALRELFYELSDRPPRVTFREPYVWGEEDVEELVDSIEPHSLEQFTLEGKIEFLDSRKLGIAVSEFVKIARGRLRSAFLQQFGILVIAVRKEDLEEAKKALEESARGTPIYTCRYGGKGDRCGGEEESFERLISITGVKGGSPGFYEALKIYREAVRQTMRRLSVFVRRDRDASDRHQYPMKVAVFAHLLNRLRKSMNVSIKSYKDLYEFAGRILRKGSIAVEEPIDVSGKQVIPDIIYRPGNGGDIYIEIESLVGTLEPMKKIDETIEKYEGKPGARVWVVVRPVSALLHYEELRSRLNAYKAVYGNLNIEFKVLLLRRSRDGRGHAWDLVDLEEFVRWISCREAS